MEIYSRSCKEKAIKELESATSSEDLLTSAVNMLKGLVFTPFLDPQERDELDDYIRAVQFSRLRR